MQFICIALQFLIHGSSQVQKHDYDNDSYMNRMCMVSTQRDEFQSEHGLQNHYHDMNC